MSRGAGDWVIPTGMILLGLLGFIGWVMNIVAIAHQCCTPLTGVMVLRIVGIFIAPLGSVMGWFV